MHDKFMMVAINLASENIDQGGGPFGAVVVLNDQIIGRGANRVTENKDPSAHAEIMAIRDACKNIDNFSLKGATIYTSCEPCPMCLSAIYWARIDKVYYANSRVDAAEIGFSDEYIYEQLALEDKDKDLKLIRICENDGIKSFKKWDNSVEKVEY